MTNKKYKVYFANGLFSEMEQDYNKKVVNLIRNHKFLGNKTEIYLPQENEAINDKSGYADSKMIAMGDLAELETSDILIAVIDGQVMDVGVATEIGIAYARGIYTFLLYTDSRQGTYGNSKKVEALDKMLENQFHYVNLFTTGVARLNGCSVRGTDSLLEKMESLIVNYGKKNENELLDDSITFKIGEWNYKVTSSSKETANKMSEIFSRLGKISSDINEMKNKQDIPNHLNNVVRGFHCDKQGNNLQVNEEDLYDFYLPYRLKQSTSLVWGDIVRVSTQYGEKLICIDDFDYQEDAFIKHRLVLGKV